MCSTRSGSSVKHGLAGLVALPLSHCRRDSVPCPHQSPKPCGSTTHLRLWGAAWGGHNRAQWTRTLCVFPLHACRHPCPIAFHLQGPRPKKELLRISMRTPERKTQHGVLCDHAGPVRTKPVAKLSLTVVRTRVKGKEIQAQLQMGHHQAKMASLPLRPRDTDETVFFILTNFR